MMRIADHVGEKEAAATQANDVRRWCWPSVAKLALACGRSDRTVQTALEQLEAAGLIEKAVRFERDSGRQTTNHYRIVWKEVGRLINVAPMSCWKRPTLNRTAKTSPPPRSHFTPPVKFQSKNFTPPVKPLHPLNGIETQELQIPPTDRPSRRDDPIVEATVRTGGRRTVFGVWFDAETLRSAIRRRQSRTLRRAFDELGDAATFAAPVPSDAFLLFAALAYDATRAAKTSPVGLLVSRLTRGEVNRECVTSEGMRWAKELVFQTPVAQPDPSPIESLTDEQREKAATRQPTEECWLCAARGEKSPTCDVCGTKPWTQPVRGTKPEEGAVHA